MDGEYNETQAMLDHERCSEENLEENQFYCASIVSTITQSEVNWTMLPIYYDFYPDGTSVKNSIH